MYLFSPTSSKRAVGEAVSLFTAAQEAGSEQNSWLDLKAG